MSGPTIIFGKSTQTQWHDCANGDLLLDVEGKRLLLHRNHETGLFHFDHDSLVDGVQGGIVKDTISEANGTLHAFRIGPMFFEVVGWKPDVDVYICRSRPNAKPRPLVSLPAYSRVN